MFERKEREGKEVEWNREIPFPSFEYQKWSQGKEVGGEKLLDLEGKN